MFIRVIFAAVLTLGLIFGQTSGSSDKSAKSTKSGAAKPAKQGQSSGTGDVAYPTPGTVNGTADTSVEAKGGLIDINSASVDDLKGLGIADEWAQRIVNHRPYATKYQLVQKNIIPAPAYTKIKDKIIARQKPAAR